MAEVIYLCGSVIYMEGSTGFRVKMSYYMPGVFLN